MNKISFIQGLALPSPENFKAILLAPSDGATATGVRIMADQFEQRVEAMRRKAHDDAADAFRFMLNTRAIQDAWYYARRLAEAHWLARPYYRLARWFQLRFPNYIALD